MNKPTVLMVTAMMLSSAMAAAEQSPQPRPLFLVEPTSGVESNPVTKGGTYLSCGGQHAVAMGRVCVSAEGSGKQAVFNELTARLVPDSKGRIRVGGPMYTHARAKKDLSPRDTRVSGEVLRNVDDEYHNSWFKALRHQSHTEHCFFVESPLRAEHAMYDEGTDELCATVYHEPHQPETNTLVRWSWWQTVPFLGVLILPSLVNR